MRYIITTSIFALLGACLSVQALASEAPVLSLLSDAEQSYYLKVFDYSMDNKQPGEKFDWASFSGKGTITVDKIFVSKSGYTCRNFSENYTVQEKTQDVKGVACKRQGADGWCRLRPTNAMTCAMEDPSFTFGGVGVSTPNVTVGGINGGSIEMPAITGGGSSGVNTSGMVSSNNNRNNSKGGNPTATGYADTVTGTAGKAAGPAASGAINWFSRTFLR